MMLLAASAITCARYGTADERWPFSGYRNVVVSAVSYYKALYPRRSVGEFSPSYFSIVKEPQKMPKSMTVE